MVDKITICLNSLLIGTTLLWKNMLMNLKTAMCSIPIKNFIENITNCIIVIMHDSKPLILTKMVNYHWANSFFSEIHFETKMLKQSFLKEHSQLLIQIKTEGS